MIKRALALLLLSSACYSGGFDVLGGGGSGSVNSSTQYSVPYYSSVGSSNSLSGSELKVYSSSITLGTGAFQIFVPAFGNGTAGRFVTVSTAITGNPLTALPITSADIPVISSGVAFGSSSNGVTQDTTTFRYNNSTKQLYLANSISASSGTFGSLPATPSYTQIPILLGGGGGISGVTGAVAPGLVGTNMYLDAGQRLIDCSQGGQALSMDKDGQFHFYKVAASCGATSLEEIFGADGNNGRDYDLNVWPKVGPSNRAIHFRDWLSANYVGFKASTTIPASVTWTLPSGDSRGFWKSDGASNLSIYDLFGDSPTFRGQTAWTSVSPSTFTGTVNVGGLTGASLTACGDSTHALSWSGGSFGCQSIGGSATTILAVTSGTSSGYLGTPISSPTAVLAFDNSQMNVTLQSATTAFVTISYSTKSVTGNYTATSTDTIVAANCGSNCTVTLPTAVGISGKVYKIKKINTGSIQVTVATTSAQTIDGATTQVLTMQYTTLDVISDGSNWMVL